MTVREGHLWLGDDNHDIGFYYYYKSFISSSSDSTNNNK